MIKRTRFMSALTAMTVVVATACSAPRSRATITVGVTMAYFDDNWLSILRNAMAEHGRTLPDVQLQFDDAQGDVGKQLSQIQNFIAQGASAIVVNTVDSTATPKMTRLAR